MAVHEMNNPELMPSTDKDRDINIWDFTMLWAGMTINMGAFTMGAQLYPGLSPWTIIGAILAAYTIVTTILILAGDIGIRYGIPFTVYIRGCFGYQGAKIPAAFRAIPACFWFGFQTWVAAVAIGKVLEMWIGYSNTTILILIFGVLQVINAIYGMKAMAKFDWVAIPALTILIGLVTFWLLQTNNATIGDVLAAPSLDNGSFWFAVMAIAGIWITMGLNSPDMTRKLERSRDHSSKNFFIRNRKPFFAQISGLIVIGSGILMVGMIGGILTGTWDPIEIVLNSMSSPIVLILSMITIAFAQWSTNTAANLMPSALILMNVFPRLNFGQGVAISGAIGLLMMPWVFADNLLWFSVITSGLLGPVAGIMLADFYLLRRGQLNVDDFYNPRGPFVYQNNYNLRAFLVYGLSFACSLVFIDLAFFVGLVVSVVGYYLLMKPIARPAGENAVSAQS
ncbi:cytosine permease [Oceanisphaera sp. KMM 10153]|uniref:cytosine permease n=1 Tax=Oceanisphaera submarina TaxID=3390193 RepID=UPI003976CD30